MAHYTVKCLRDSKCQKYCNPHNLNPGPMGLHVVVALAVYKTEYYLFKIIMPCSLHKPVGLTEKQSFNIFVVH